MLCLNIWILSIMEKGIECASTRQWSFFFVVGSSIYMDMPNVGDDEIVIDSHGVLLANDDDNLVVLEWTLRNDNDSVLEPTSRNDDDGVSETPGNDDDDDDDRVSESMLGNDDDDDGIL